MLKKTNPSDGDIIDEWNKIYAHVLAGGKSCILQEFTTADGRIDFKLLSSAAFKEWNAEYKVRTGEKNGKPVFAPAAEIWLHNPRRRKFQDIGFFPGREAPNFYNLWRGFAVEPKKGVCSKFLAHLRDNVCQGDEGLFVWTEAWLADIFQHPDKKCETSLALRGHQGVGKTKIGEVIGSLLGTHYVLVSEARYITGKFNSHMLSLLLLHADEAFWAGDRRAEGRLRDFVTGKSHPIEFKGKDAFWVNNYARLLVTGNHDWQVPAGFGERRFAILDVGTAHQQDYPYFAAIDEEMNNGGREALLHHLLFEVDCSKVNLRQIPRTTALLEQKIETATTEQGWWLEVLQHGQLPESTSNVVSKDALFRDYLEHAKRKGATHRSIETKIGMFLYKMVKKLKTERPIQKPGKFESRGRMYRFPPLKECREEFCAALGQDVAWEEPKKKWGS